MCIHVVAMNPVLSLCLLIVSSLSSYLKTEKTKKSCKHRHAVFISACVCVCVCVCERERESERVSE